MWKVSWNSFRGKFTKKIVKCMGACIPFIIVCLRFWYVDLEHDWMTNIAPFILSHRALLQLLKSYGFCTEIVCGMWSSMWKKNRSTCWRLYSYYMHVKIGFVYYFIHTTAKKFIFFTFKICISQVYVLFTEVFAKL